MTTADPPSPSEPRLVLSLFGPFAGRLNHRSLPPTRTRKEQWLLALLALRQGRDVERAWLAGTLWPDADESRALANLRRSLSNLRTVLGAEASRLSAGSAHTISLDLCGADVDVAAFDAALARGDPSSLARAVALYRGPLLEGCLEEWVLPERDAREQACLNALETLATDATARGETPVALDYLRRIVHIDPLRESAQRGLMTAWAAHGDHAAAGAAYRAFRLLMHRELNAEPDAETTALFHRIRAEGRQRVQTSALPPTPARTPRSPIHLPHPLTRLIGREGELRATLDCLETARLVTLTGAGGIGKTRLAIAAAQEAAERYPGGVWFVDLAPLDSRIQVAPTIARLLGVQEERDQPLIRTLCRHLQDQNLLLILDNCEHLLDACAPLVEELLADCPHLHVLATSRQSLGVRGETVRQVPPLSLPPDETPSAPEKEAWALWGQSEAFQLFAERASQCRPAYPVSLENRAVIDRICRRLDGIPLAIELAAARTRMMTVEEIHAHLSDQFRLLTGGPRTVLPRQQTLRAAVDWSYALLDGPERALLARLSVFAGGWTLEAAEAVAVGPEIEEGDVLDLLSSLVDKSLALAEPHRESTRYRMLETVRQYGQARLQESEEGPAVRSRHRDYFLALAEEAYEPLVGPEQAIWLERLEAQHDNLRAALSWCREDAGGAEKGLRLARALWKFWSIRGYVSEGRRWLQAALDQAATVEDRALRAMALNAAGHLAFKQGDYGSAWTAHQASLSLRREIGERRGIAASLHALGNVAYERGDGGLAQPLYEESLALAREAGSKRDMAVSLNALGNAILRRGDCGRAGALHRESLALRQELGDQRGIAVALGNLGNVAYEQRDYASAQRFYSEALSLIKDLGDKPLAAILLVPLAETAQAQEHSERAACLFGAAEVLSEATQSPLPPTERDRYDQTVAAVRAGLGQAAFAAAWTAGRAMTMDQAIEYALTETASSVA